MTHAPDAESPQEPPKKGLQAIELSLSLPLEDEEVAHLRAGDWVVLSGSLLLISREAGVALCEEWDEEEIGQWLTEDSGVFFGEVSEAPLGKVMGSVEPNFMRQNAMLCSAMLDAGVGCLVGSGPIGLDAVERLKKKRGLYLTTLRGAGALLARSIHQAEVIAQESLGIAAVRRIKVSRLPCMIALDGFGRYLWS